MALSEMLMQVIKQLPEALAFTRCSHRANHPLRLPTVTVRRHHQPPGDDIRRFMAEIFAHQMQTEIDTAALPAEVISRASPTYSTSSTTSINGKRCCSRAV